VVVCAYNASATLDECLSSLTKLDYPDYELILVDDGSTDQTPQIAARFPQVRCIRQENRGLSVARNVGAEAATGEIVAYTDADCIADEHWLHYLVVAMQEGDFDAIGGPNIPPPRDSWMTQCVAASPGGPNHVMLDDRRAEHVPGCNMAFRRKALLAIGGFDPQFVQAGDDVDICWRFVDAGMSIGYAPSAVVWHHRRRTIRAYIRQQKGYGRAEGMLQLKHPHRFTSLGTSRWLGVVYGQSARPAAELVYYGRFGSALFQIVYPVRQSGFWSYCLLAEWHAISTFFAILAILFWPLGIISALMWLATLLAALRTGLATPLPPSRRWWCRPLVCWLHLLQPLVRSWHRRWYRLRKKRLPAAKRESLRDYVKSISWTERDLYWTSEKHGRREFLAALVEQAKHEGWCGDYRAEWKTWDLALAGDRWHDVEIRTVTEELGVRGRFTRVRSSVRMTLLAFICGAVASIWSIVAVATRHKWAAVGGLVVLAALLVSVLLSRRRCQAAVCRLIWRAGKKAALQPVPSAEHLPEPPAAERAECASALAPARPNDTTPSRCAEAVP